MTNNVIYSHKKMGYVTKKLWAKLSEYGKKCKNETFLVQMTHFFENRPVSFHEIRTPSKRFKDIYIITKLMIGSLR